MAERTLRLPLGDKSPTARLLYGQDVRDGLRALPESSVHCVVTSPPYWGLRDYGTDPTVWGGDKSCAHEWVSARYYTEKSAGKSSAANFTQAGDENAARVKESRWREDDTCGLCGAWRGHLGLENTPSLYVEHLVDVFSEVARVLRPDGTLWLNLGDSYMSGGGGGEARMTEIHGKRDTDFRKGTLVQSLSGNRPIKGTSLKTKDLILVPFRVALAMQEAGWYLRSWAPWIKRNCLPEAVTDRPSNALEVMYLFAHPKSRGRYFYDMGAVRKPLADANAQRTTEHWDTTERYGVNNGGNTGLDSLASRMRDGSVTGRNRRNTDWFFESIEAIRDGKDDVLPDDEGIPLAHVVNPRPYQGAHFAVMPPAIVEPCITASTSEHGVCPTCAAPWRRDVERDVRPPLDRQNNNPFKHDSGTTHGEGKHTLRNDVRWTTAGWTQSCSCPVSLPVPATVLDPFSGSGTVGMVSLRVGRHYVGLDLNESYLSLAEARILGAAPPAPMPTEMGSALDLFGDGA